MASYLDIRKLHEIQERRNRSKQRIYEVIMRKIHHQIETVSERGDVTMMYKVPEFMIGSPTYNAIHCINYTLHRLHHEGFKVKYLNPHILWINWEKDDSDHLSLPSLTTTPTPTPTLTPKVNYVPTGKLFS